jgi:hypothetical protein
MGLQTNLRLKEQDDAMQIEMKKLEMSIAALLDEKNKLETKLTRKTRK